MQLRLVQKPIVVSLGLIEILAGSVFGNVVDELNKDSKNQTCNQPSLFTQKIG